MQKKVNVIYKLEGENIDEGIDVFELAPFLLALGKLIQASQSTLNPDGREISVNVKPFEKGSFIVDIILFAQTNAQQLISFVNSEDVQEIKELLEWIGIVSGVGVTTYGAGKSLISLIKFLKGQPKKIEKLKPNEYRYTPHEGNAITVPQTVHQLFQNCEIQGLTQKVYVGLLDQENDIQVSSYIKGEEEKATVVYKNEVESFRNLTEQDIPGVEDETIENESILYLNPKRGSYEGESGSWSFRKSNDRQGIITATIKDTSFLEKVKSGEIRPNHKDLLKVKMLEKQKIIGSEVSSVSYEIVEVIDYQEYKPPPRLIE